MLKLKSCTFFFLVLRKLFKVVLAIRKGGNDCFASAKLLYRPISWNLLTPRRNSLYWWYRGITSSLTLLPLSHGEHHVCWANPTMQMWWTGGYRMGWVGLDSYTWTTGFTTLCVYYYWKVIVCFNDEDKL